MGTLSDYERVSIALLAALVGLQIADSGDTRRKALALGRAAIDDALTVMEDDAESRELVSSDPS